VKYAPIGYPLFASMAPFMSRGYHFALGQELIRDDRYRNIYTHLHRIGSFIIVDNGAAEEDTPPFIHIVGQASAVGADEIILPDVLKDGELTVRAMQDSRAASLVPARYRFVVPQGKSWDEVLYCMTAIHTLLAGEYQTIGIPKHMEELPGGRAYGIKLLMEAGYGNKYHMHMLGVYGDAHTEIAAALRVHPSIRGIDSGLAVAATQRAKRVTSGMRYSLSWGTVSPANTKLLAENIYTIEKWCDEPVSYFGHNGEVL
jgi:hypothetical protein